MSTYAIDELYKLNAKLEHTFENDCITIDNFYENPDAIYDHLMKRDYPLWKYNPERKSPNGIDYNDCRIVDKVAHPTRIYENENQRVLDICRRYFWKGQYDWSRLIEFNCFQTINVFDNKLQHYPHIDSELSCPNETATLNFLVYLDKEEDGGTAVYGGEWITNHEEQSLLFPVEEKFNIQHIIPAKFNRAVIFPGNRMHGAYINNYDNYKDDKWRFTQVIFYHPCQR